MTTKIAKFARIGFRRAGLLFAGSTVASVTPVPLGAVALAHSNDNAKIIGGVRRQRTRPVLACSWRPATGGGLECCWDVDPRDAAPLEPDPCPTGFGMAPGLARAA